VDSVLLLIILGGVALCAVTFAVEYLRWRKSNQLARAREIVLRTLYEKRLSVLQQQLRYPSSLL
jgi:hypothetical protein